MNAVVWGNQLRDTLRRCVVGHHDQDVRRRVLEHAREAALEQLERPEHRDADDGLAAPQLAHCTAWCASICASVTCRMSAPLRYDANQSTTAARPRPRSHAGV